MPMYSDFAAVIFDIDGTLLDDQPPGETMGLHEQSRMLAAHEVGKRHAITSLQNFTPQQCREAFANAKAHVIQAVVWQMLVMAKQVPDKADMDPDNPLLKEIVELKEQLHEDILRTKGREVPGAARFVEAWATNGFTDKLAIASTACRRDIDIFLEMTNLARFFPNAKIISREQLAHAKPHPEAFNLAFAALGLPETKRPRALVFEDDPRGIMSAKAAGLYTCAITTRFTKADLAGLTIPPDLIADSFAEFARALDLPFMATAPAQ